MAPVALLTGAAGGIGGATVERFVAGGWKVAAVDIKAIEPAIDSATGSADDVRSIGADLSRVEHCRRAVAEAVQWSGRLDAVVNAAGLWTEGSSAETTEDEWDRVIDVNLKGLYFVCSAAIPHLTATGGCIVNMSSDAGVQGNAGAAVYCASKGGVSNLTRALALELAPLGVRVNAVCPGDVDSPMLRGQAAASADPTAYLDKLLRGYPQGSGARFIQPAEIAELIWFLAQPSATAITGANIAIDFGLSAGIT
ncbi:MAG: SDR family oxidoreductase [Actinomycetota bacterium]|nr:SDR family oxidoreductase [Actinomycetota bacterium]